MLRYHLRHAIRRLLREPSFTLSAVLTLALGVGANVAVFAVVEAVLLRPLPYLAAESLVIVNHRDVNTGIAKPFIAIGDFVDLTKRQRTFERLAAYGGVQATIFGRGEPYRVAGLSAGPGLLDMLGAQPVAGRLLQPEDSREGAAPVMMLGYQLWQDHFGGDRDIIGKSVRVGSTDREVVGIAPPELRFPPTSHAEVILPQEIPETAPAGRKSDWVFALGRLRSGQTLRTATAGLAALSSQLATEYPQTNLASTYFAEDLRESLVGSLRPALLLLLGAVAAVLLIACANVANLLLVRALGRRRKMSLRLALGAGRGRLAMQMAAESLVLALVAGAAGLLVAHWGVRALIALVPESISAPGLADASLNPVVLGFAMALTLVAAVVFGMVSTLTVRSEDAAGALVTGARASVGSGARRAAAALVAVEIAFAIVLLMSAGLMIRSFTALLRVDPGFKPDHVMTVAVTLPGARFDSVSARSQYYQNAFRPGSPATVIVSEEVQRTYFPGAHAVGRMVRIAGQPREIVGVVGDIRRAGLRDVPRADIYLPFDLSPARSTTLFARTTGDAAALLPAMRNILRQMEANVVLLQPQTLAAVASDSLGDLRLVLWLLGIFAVTALALAAVGIYGVMAYVVRQRTREIGTRIALGASRSSIIWLVMREGGMIAAVGAGVGLSLGLFATRALRSLLYGVGSSDPVALIGATIVLTLAALFACYLPARRASGLDPARTLSAP